ncbi:MAG: hypothetical protein AXA67_08120 [Methylothermaceae bacteria B42]|nr:MAG: hypothetical protein AXA67_08120 [Methylothermaceae bacteria B42]
MMEPETMSEHLDLLSTLLKPSYRPQRPLDDRWPTDHFNQGQDWLLDLRNLLIGLMEFYQRKERRRMRSDVSFRVTRGSTLATEAIEPLAVLLTDVCPLLFGIIGRGCLPGLLIHDSPREADHGLIIYRSCLE